MSLFQNTSFIAFFHVLMFSWTACLNVFIFSEMLDVSVSWYVKIIRKKAEIQSSAAKIVYQVSGKIFNMADAIRGVIIAAASQ